MIWFDDKPGQKELHITVSVFFEGQGFPPYSASRRTTCHLVLVPFPQVFVQSLHSVHFHVQLTVQGENDIIKPLLDATFPELVQMHVLSVIIFTWARIFIARAAQLERRTFFPHHLWLHSHASVSGFCSISTLNRAVAPRTPVSYLAVNWDSRCDYCKL